jgi:hypothetical protein
MVRVEGFAPSASRPRTVRSTELSYTLMKLVGMVRVALTIFRSQSGRVKLLRYTPNGGYGGCCPRYLFRDREATLLFVLVPINPPSRGCWDVQ